MTRQSIQFSCLEYWAWIKRKGRTLRRLLLHIVIFDLCGSDPLGCKDQKVTKLAQSQRRNISKKNSIINPHEKLDQRPLNCSQKAKYSLPGSYILLIYLCAGVHVRGTLGQ